jgi:polyhydroxyalkanoate synthesis regulator protein
MIKIVRYSNRKLYDRTKSRYITLGDLADSLRENSDDVVVTLKGSDLDMTLETLAQAISVEISAGARCDKSQLIALLRSLKKPAEPAVVPVSTSATTTPPAPPARPKTW